MTKRSIIVAISLSAAIILLFSYSNCSQTEFIKVNGTTVGNPMAPVSSEIMLGLCGLINRCNPQVTVEVCENGILQTSGFASPLGLSSNFDTYSYVVQGEQSGALSGNSTAAAGCYDSINSLNCSDPAAAGAYNPSLSNPFAGAPNLISGTSCAQSFSPGINLEVPIEMNAVGLASNTASTTFSRSRTSLNTSDYDGIVSYNFEIVAENADSAQRNVYLVDSSGARVATIAVSANSAATRLASSFTPTSGANNYRIQLDGTTSTGQLQVWVGRVLVDQTGATQTKIFVPLISGAARVSFSSDDASAQVDGATSANYSQPDGGWWDLWRKNNSAFSQLASSNPWTLEAVLSGDSGATAYVSVFDASTGLQVSSSEASSTSSTPALVQTSFPDSASNFNDLDTMELQIKETGGSGAHIYRAGLWIKLTNLTHAEVYYRYLFADNWQFGDTPGDEPQYLIFPNLSVFSGSASYYSELTSAVSTSGASCTESLFDNGQSDSGYSGNIVSGSTLMISSTVVTRQRSQALGLVPGHRYSYYISPNPGAGTCNPLSAFLVVGF